MPCNCNYVVIRYVFTFHGVTHVPKHRQTGGGDRCLLLPWCTCSTDPDDGLFYLWAPAFNHFASQWLHFSLKPTELSLSHCIYLALVDEDDRLYYIFCHHSDSWILSFYGKDKFDGSEVCYSMQYTGRLFRYGWFVVCIANLCCQKMYLR